MLRNWFLPIPMFDLAGGEGAGGAGGNAQPWYQGKADDETVGYFVRRGWDKDPTIAAIEASKAHREAEKKLSIPSAELMRVPTKLDDPAWAQVWQRLGAGKTAEEYDLSNVKVNDKPMDPALVATLQKLAHSLNLPKDKAPILAAEIAKLDVNKTSAAEAERAARITTERDALNKNWGNNRDANMLIARNAAAQAGLDPEIVNALEQVAGYAKTMEALRNIGVRMGEDKFIRNDLKPGGGVMSKQEAMDKKADLMRDKDWSKRYADGGVKEKKEMMDLLTIISAR